jgi:hypothetical protein
VGINRRGTEEWKAVVEVVERDDETSYAFVTGGVELNLVLWRCELRRDGDATVLTAQWTMRNPAFFVERSGEAEESRLTDNTKESIATTVREMKATAEGRAPG